MSEHLRLTIYLDENEYAGRHPLYREVLEFLKKEKVKGVTVFKGVFGWGPDGIVHTVNILRASSSLPLKIEIIESVEVIERLLPGLKKLVFKGLITTSPVEIVHRPNGK